MSTTEGAFHGIVMICLSPFIFWSGIKRLKFRRIMRDTPTSKIDSAALGSFVEIQGKVYCDDMMRIKAPLTKYDCAAYILKIERLVTKKRSSEWILDKFLFSNPYIYLNDGGQFLAAIDFGACDIKGLQVSRVFEFVSEDDLDSGLKTLFTHEKLLSRTQGFPVDGQSRYRLVEQVLVEGQELYAMGTAVTPPYYENAQGFPHDENEKEIFFSNTTSRHAQQLNYAEKVLSRDPQVIPLYDANGNNFLELGEVKKLRRDLNERIEEETSNSLYIKNSKLFLTVSELNKKLFGVDKVVLSTYSEKELANRLIFMAWVKIIAAPMLMILGVFIFNYKVN